MNEANGYAVFFFPQALEALGEAITPYLQDGPSGQHVLCNEIDTAGSLIEMTIRGTSSDGKIVVMELMVPGSMVRMIVSSQSDGSFGFGPRARIVAGSALPTSAGAAPLPDAPQTKPSAPSATGAPGPGGGGSAPEQS